MEFSNQGQGEWGDPFSVTLQWQEQTHFKHNKDNCNQQNQLGQYQHVHVFSTNKTKLSMFLVPTGSVPSCPFFEYQLGQYQAIPVFGTSWASTKLSMLSVPVGQIPSYPCFCYQLGQYQTVHVLSTSWDKTNLSMISIPARPVPS